MSQKVNSWLSSSASDSLDTNIHNEASEDSSNLAVTLFGDSVENEWLVPKSVDISTVIQNDEDNRSGPTSPNSNATYSIPEAQQALVTVSGASVATPTAAIVDISADCDNENSNDHDNNIRSYSQQTDGYLPTASRQKSPDGIKQNGSWKTPSDEKLLGEVNDLKQTLLIAGFAVPSDGMYIYTLCYKSAKLLPLLSTLSTSDVVYACLLFFCWNPSCASYVCYLLLSR